MVERIGIIGGSGLYQIDGVKVKKKFYLKTPFGRPSGQFVLGYLEGKEVVFLPRHDVGHRISPSHINYRANIYAMKKLGVGRIISLAACGSLKEEIRPMDFVVADQFVDRTNHARDMSFFEEGIVAHIEFSHPVCEELRGILCRSAKEVTNRVHNGGTYINMEGPAFSTLAESALYRSWNMDIIGMTNFAEAKLAREAEMCYATVAAVTDYDCWHPSHDAVSIEMVTRNLSSNIDNSKKILSRVIRAIPGERGCSCGSALEHAIITDRRYIPRRIKKKLSIIIGKYVK
ncbi:MAG: S-methyl-5'-thioadenosine phosphorylase [Candidatus Omnitrophota bacterium]